MTKQSNWKYVGNLGDTDPIDHGGLFVFVDETGVYDPEMELLEMDNPEVLEEVNQRFTIHRVVLDKCYWDGTILSNNEFHKDHHAWWATPEIKRNERPQDSTYLKNLIDQSDSMTIEGFAMAFCSDDILTRAAAYREVFEYHGWENGDSEPLTGLTRQEVEERYKDCKPT